MLPYAWWLQVLEGRSPMAPAAHVCGGRSWCGRTGWQRQRKGPRSGWIWMVLDIAMPHRCRHTFLGFRRHNGDDATVVGNCRPARSPSSCHGRGASWVASIASFCFASLVRVGAVGFVGSGFFTGALKLISSRDYNVSCRRVFFTNKL
jgi:hypothetical protein